ncbi:MAG: Xanthine dehydrogenase [Rhizobacter sp.]|nr:Xanthine dehydrogenase [Rhizobacter sp.]
MSMLEKVVELAVGLMPDKHPDPLINAHGAVGSPLSRVDGPLKVSGAARFTAEVALADMTYAALAYSSVAKGRIVRIDANAARAMPGVVAVMTHENVPRMQAPPAMMMDPNGAAMSNLPVMQDDRIHWNGQPVAAVIALTQEAADQAAALLRVEVDAEPATLSFEGAFAQAHPPKDVLGQPAEVKVGDAEAAFRDAPLRIDALYRTPRHYNSAIELHATTASWDGDRLTVHDTSQTLQSTRYTIAETFGIPKENVRVLAPFVGGAFGSKGVWNHTLICIAAARLVQRPVRLTLSREGVFRATGGRTLSQQRVALGARADGTLAALIHTGTTAVVSHNAFPEQFNFPARHLYAADTLLLQQEVVELDMVANTAMRAPGESVGTFALESALDELAIASRIDPIELRRRIEPDKDPSKGTPFSSRHLVEAYRRGAERFGWARRPIEPRSQRDGEWWVGQGVATAYYPYFRRPAAARIRITADGRAVVQASAHEMGMGTATVQAQHAAERLGLSVDRVTFEYGDTDQPDSPIAGGSCQTASVAAAVIAAADAIKQKLLDLAGSDSPLSGAQLGDVNAVNGGLFRCDQPERGERYESMLRRAGLDHLECEADAAKPTELLKYSMGSYGAQFCEVRVNDLTGEIRVSRWLGSFDTGRILNAKTAASQFRGGIIMGIGMALMEDSLFDERSGRFMNPSLAEYQVPVHLDVPPIDVIWNDIPDPHSPLGLHGIGEIGITGAAAAIANAVHHAIGHRFRELPITLDKVLERLMSG